jgi:ribosomal protein S16
MLPGTGNLEVFANKRSHRDEKSFELIGEYGSFAAEQNFKLDLDRVDYWMTNALKK